MTLCLYYSANFGEAHSQTTVESAVKFHPHRSDTFEETGTIICDNYNAFLCWCVRWRSEIYLRV